MEIGTGKPVSRRSALGGMGGGDGTATGWCHFTGILTERGWEGRHSHGLGP